MNLSSEIWLLEDDIDSAEIFQSLLGRHYEDVRHFGDLDTFSSALTDPATAAPAFLIADLNIGERNLLDSIRLKEVKLPESCPWILMTGSGDPKITDLAKRCGASLCISKKFEEWELIGHIRGVLTDRFEQRRADLLRSTPADSVERRLVSYILTNRDAAFMRDELLAQGWPNNAGGSRTLLDGALHRLRPKFQATGFRLEHAETELGSGWKLFDSIPSPIVKE